MIRHIPLHQLVASDANVRSDRTVEDIAELQASIAAHGLLQPLVVKEVDGNFEVVDGETRRLAMVALVAATATPGPEIAGLMQSVPCTMVGDEHEAGEISLAANIVRTNLHPVDWYREYKRLADKGVTVTQIANRFGTTVSVVERRLALGLLPEKVLKAYQLGKIDDRWIQAATRLPAKAILRALKDGSTWWQLQQMFNEVALPVEFALEGVRQAYDDAGGTYTRDLFPDEGPERANGKPLSGEHFAKRDLFWKWQDVAIDKMVAVLKGEGWGEIAVVRESEKGSPTAGWSYHSKAEQASKKGRAGLSRKIAVRGTGMVTLYDDTYVSPAQLKAMRAEATLKLKKKAAKAVGEDPAEVVVEPDRPTTPRSQVRDAAKIASEMLRDFLADGGKDGELWSLRIACFQAQGRYYETSGLKFTPHWSATLDRPENDWPTVREWTKVKCVEHLAGLGRQGLGFGEDARARGCTWDIATAIGYADKLRKWTPDEAFLEGYQKAQLIRLVREIMGDKIADAQVKTSKKDLVAKLATTFKNPAETGRRWGAVHPDGDAALAAVVRGWIPWEMRLGERVTGYGADDVIDQVEIEEIEQEGEGGEQD